MEKTIAPTRAQPSEPVELVIIDESGAERIIKFAGGRATIGRSQDSTVFLDHHSVSRHHAQLLRDPFSRWWLRDLGSRNGTRLDGHAIEGEVMVPPNQEIAVGLFRLRVRTREPDELAGAGVAGGLQMVDQRFELSTIELTTATAISASQLSSIVRLGQELARIEQAAERTERLCAAMVGPQFRALDALVLRLNPRAPDQPPVLLRRADRAGAEARPHISRSLLRFVLQNSKASIGSNTADHADVVISRDAATMPLSAIACPLRRDEGALYVLYVTVPSECATPDWLALVALAASQFQYAEAECRVRKRARIDMQIRHDLERAEAIQRRIVPPAASLPGLDVATSWIPCRWVGGDYADIVVLDRTRVVIAVGDVCGKGLQGALVVSSLHAMVRTTMHAGSSLQACVQLANHHFSTYLPAGSFITFLALCIDTQTGECEYVNAGHPPPMLVGPDGSLSLLSQAGGPPLGIASHDIGGACFTMPRGATLALCTDGWIELADPAGAQLGIEQVADTIRRCVVSKPTEPLATVRDHVVGTLDSFRAGSLVADDRTLMLARRCTSSPL